MKTLTIKDLPRNDVLDRQTLTTVQGGIGRTGPQILAWEISGKPATWQGLVLSDDGRPSVPTI